MNLLSCAPSTMRLWYRRLGVRVNCGGLRNRSWTSLCACFSVRPLQGC